MVSEIPRVAIVEDDQSTARALARLLGISGVQSATYHSAEAFLSDPGHAHFDCLILDVQLGGISGLELQRRLKDSPGPRSSPPIVFLTAHDEPEKREQALSVGCIAYLTKTESAQVLLEAIGQGVRLRCVGDLVNAVQEELSGSGR